MSRIVPLGAPITPSVDLGPVVAALRDQIATQVEQAISERLMAVFVDNMRTVVARAVTPTINVAAPQVNVAAPQVTVPPPAVTVTSPVEIPGMAEFAAQLAAVNQSLGQLLNLFQRPVHKTVERDSFQNIREVIETR